METIAAIATPPGRGAIAIVRCSGPEARRIAQAIFRSHEPLRDRMVTYGRVLDVEGMVIDRALAVAMDAPRTATGEDVVEFHLHGSPIAARETLRAVIHAGARIAAPGEFTRRAYLNGKLDLSAAEAVADLIDAETRAGARAAEANLAGGLRREITAIRAPLATMVEELSGAIDYPDEVPEPPASRIADAVAVARRRLDALVADWERGRVAREGLGLAIVGPPNAGKSSLLNALVGEDRAIVSPIPGTTRDVVEDRFAIDGILVRVSDTAGIRVTEDPIERLGIERARAVGEAATLLLVVVDGSRPLDADARTMLAETRPKRRLVFYNKRDLGTAGFSERSALDEGFSGSTLDPSSIEAIRAEIIRESAVDGALDLQRPHLASARQADAVARAQEALELAAVTIESGNPSHYAVTDLVAALAALGEVTGGEVTEAVLDGIFARFCVGK